MRFVWMLLLVPSLVGCVSSPSMLFGAVSISALPISPVVLQTGAIGEDCPKGSGSYGSYSLAAERAISSVPNANALINARFMRTERPLATICVRVIGDAVRL